MFKNITLGCFRPIFARTPANPQFQAKADQAAAVLMAFGEAVPVPQRSLQEVDIDTDTSTSNHEWPGNLQDSISSLIAYLRDIDRMRDEYWVALERVSQTA